tara:strand:- start:39 stop:404 length:366 start_codon:yes stop_codon:yes gene_type:complete
VAELAVAARLVELGFDLFWPVNEQPPIDVITVWKSVIKRIQIKSKNSPRDSQLSQEVRIDTLDSKKCDFLIAYLARQTAFYVLPTSVVKNKKTLVFYPNGKTARVEHDYEKYRDAWHLLRE